MSSLFRTREVLGIGGVTVLAGIAFATLFLTLPVLYDADSYFHLAVGGLYAEQGVVDELAWARSSVLHDGYGDKELLFHLLLAPAQALSPAGDPTLGGRLALAVLNTLLFGYVLARSWRVFGPLGALLPVWAYVASMPFFTRAVRLRPELFALLLLLLAVELAARRRDRWLGVLAFVFTLSYTAFHAFLGLCGLWMVAVWFWQRERRWSLVAWPTLGTAAALLLHPHFPKNLEIWAIQNIGFFAQRSVLDVGVEIEPYTTSFLLTKMAGFWLGLAVLVWLARSLPHREPKANRTLLVGIAAGVFTVLFLLMGRFSPYATVLLLLWPLERLPAQLLRGVGASRGRWALVLVVVATAVGASSSWSVWRAFYSDAVPHEEERARVTRLLPPGAKVAAHWGTAEFYTFWGPQARYLNVLDPIFMAVRSPEAYRAQQRIWADLEPDPAATLAGVLDSDYIAYDRQRHPQGLTDRLLADPRFEPLYGGLHFLARLRRSAAEEMVLDWRLPDPEIDRFAELVAPAWLPSPASGGAVAGWIAAPLSAAGVAPTAMGASVRGPCVSLVAELDVPPAGASYELAPAGPTRLVVDGAALAAAGDLDGRLGGGLLFDVAAADAPVPVSMTTCASARGELGFYLLRRDPQSRAQ